MTLPRLVLIDKVEAMMAELERRPTQRLGVRTRWDQRLERLHHEVRQHLGVEPEPEPEASAWFRCQQAQLLELRRALRAHSVRIQKEGRREA